MNEMKSRIPRPRLFFGRKESGPVVSPSFISSAFPNIPHSPIDTPTTTLGTFPDGENGADFLKVSYSRCLQTPKGYVAKTPLDEDNPSTNDLYKEENDNLELECGNIDLSEQMDTGEKGIDAEKELNEDPFHENCKQDVDDIPPSTLGESSSAHNFESQSKSDTEDDETEAIAMGMDEVDHKKDENVISNICDTDSYVDRDEMKPQGRRTLRERFFHGHLAYSGSSSSSRRSVLGCRRHLSSLSIGGHGKENNSRRLSGRMTTFLKLWPLRSPKSANNNIISKENETGNYRGVSYEHRDHEEYQQSIMSDISVPFQFFRSTENVNGSKPKGGNGNGSNAQENLGSSQPSLSQQINRPVTHERNSDNDGTRNKTYTRNNATASANAEDDAIRCRSERNWLKGALESVRIRGGGMDSTWKAGVYDFQCDSQTALQELKWLLQREYFGVMVSERCTELRMKVPLTVAGKFWIIMIILTAIYNADGASRISVRRSFSDSFTVRHEDFDWFCFDVYRRMIKCTILGCSIVRFESVLFSRAYLRNLKAWYRHGVGS